MRLRLAVLAVVLAGTTAAFAHDGFERDAAGDIFVPDGVDLSANGTGTNEATSLDGKDVDGENFVDFLPNPTSGIATPASGTRAGRNTSGDLCIKESGGGAEQCFFDAADLDTGTIPAARVGAAHIDSLTEIGDLCAGSEGVRRNSGDTANECYDTTGGGTTVLSASKTADEGVSSSTTLQDDDDLTVSVAGSTTYLVKANLIVTGTNTSPDIRLLFVEPASATFDFGFSAIKDAEVYTADESTSETDNRYAVPNGTEIYHVEGVLVTSGSGTFKLQWAQFASHASTVTVKAGSSMMLVPQ